MRKITLSILLLAPFVSCKKEKQAPAICWDCTFEDPTNPTRPPETICNQTGVAPINFKDNGGNRLDTAYYECVLQ